MVFGTEWRGGDGGDGGVEEELNVVLGGFFGGAGEGGGGGGWVMHRQHKIRRKLVRGHSFWNEDVFLVFIFKQPQILVVS